MRLSVVAMATVLLCGCGPAVKGGHRVVDADQAKVANCTFVKDVTGDATFGSRTGVRVGLSQAMEQAREDADRDGATHIVWQAITTPDVTAVNGKAYRCGNAPHGHGGAD